MTAHRRRRGDLKPNPDLWIALGEGRVLREVLVDFYMRVFRDDRLAPFFRDVTVERVIEKQWSFLRDKITGTAMYFGDRPRNAHHWMVISDELFDYREELLAQCLRRAGLDEQVVEQVRAISEVFRKQIVKSAPIPKKLRGVALPLEGYETLTLTDGTFCDGCAACLGKGDTVRYHVRTGKAYCQPCMEETGG